MVTLKSRVGSVADSHPIPEARQPSQYSAPRSGRDSTQARQHIAPWSFACTAAATEISAKSRSSWCRDRAGKAAARLRSDKIGLAAHIAGERIGVLVADATGKLDAGIGVQAIERL